MSINCSDSCINFNDGTLNILTQSGGEKRGRGEALRLFFSLTEEQQWREKYRGLYPVKMNES
jgi:hypothetical protein